MSIAAKPEMDITLLLTMAVEKKASDLHLVAGEPPLLRLDGILQKMDLAPLKQKAILSMLEPLRQSTKQSSLAFDIAKLGRFRLSVFNQLQGIAAVFRIIPSTILSLADLQLPPLLADLANFPQGLVLVTGPTGEGKSTTLAAMIDSINASRQGHILTIEDPIEFIHPSKQCLINQCEVPTHFTSMATALSSVLRADPDIILIGELRDLDSIRLAIEAAETGHLVFATLHTHSAAQAINRLIAGFPAEEKPFIRSMLAESLQAVITQRLLKKVGDGRVAALEMMICTTAIRHLIRENKVAQMYSAMQTGKAEGMQTLDQHVAELLQTNKITAETAAKATSHRTLFTGASH
jgi:twitching motility protein PilT